MSKPNDMLVDKRLARRNIEKGFLDKAAFKAHIDGLPDREDNAEVVDVGEPGVEPEVVEVEEAAPEQP